jgi:hypothetical protein
LPVKKTSNKIGISQKAFSQRRCPPTQRSLRTGAGRRSRQAAREQMAPNDWKY